MAGYANPYHGSFENAPRTVGCRRWMLPTSDATLTPEDLVAAYKQLIAVEHGWRNIKSSLGLRPIHHRREDGIRDYAQLCWLGPAPDPGYRDHRQAHVAQCRPRPGPDAPGHPRHRTRHRRPRVRAALVALLALAGGPSFAVADLAAKVADTTGQPYTVRQTAYGLRKLRGKNLIANRNAAGATTYPLGRPHHQRCSPLRDHVIAPILAGVRSPRLGRKGSSWTPSTATTRPSRSTCRPSSITSTSATSHPRNSSPISFLQATCWDRVN